MPPSRPDWIERLLSLMAKKVTAKLLHRLKPRFSGMAKIVEPTAHVSSSLSWSDHSNKPRLLCLSMIYMNALQLDTKAFLVPKLLQA